MKRNKTKCWSRLLLLALVVLTGQRVSAQTEDWKDYWVDSDRIGVVELHYLATDFDDVKLSGSYGVGGTFLPWKIAPQTFAGLNFSFDCNLGVVDSDYSAMSISLGPSFGFRASRDIKFILPICLSSGDLEHFSTDNFGLYVAPSIYIGRQVGVFVGPCFFKRFKGQDDICVGFRAGFKY